MARVHSAGSGLDSRLEPLTLIPVAVDKGKSLRCVASDLWSVLQCCFIRWGRALMLLRLGSNGRHSQVKAKATGMDGTHRCFQVSSEYTCGQEPWPRCAVAHFERERLSSNSSRPSCTNHRVLPYSKQYDCHAENNSLHNPGQTADTNHNNIETNTYTPCIYSKQ